jgi:PKD repeat protein
LFKEAVMKKFLLSVALLGGTLGATSLYAQHAEHPVCGSDFKVAMEDPDFAAEYAKFNSYLQQYSQSADEKAGGYRIMPVVVHVIHTGSGASNVTDAAINTMITKLNQAYSKTPPNINTLPLRFDSIAGEAMIMFRLATKDPLGNCTNGIRRVYAPHRSSNAYDDKNFKGLSYWDRTKYLNIWIVNNITSPGDNSGGQILGYCLFPSGAPVFQDGATIASGSMTTQAVVPHEIGHHLNLIHIWGDTNCGSDEVDDTPISKSENFAWADPCTTAIKEATCYEDVTGNPRDSLLRYGIGENFQNYMDYVNNYNCPNMFTKGQIARMNATLTFFSFRKNVVSDENNIATGVQDNAPACNERAPIAEFWAEDRVVCSGTVVNFKDGSFNGTPTSWAWEFEGGTPSSSSLQNPQITYNTPGTYGVTLKVTNANGTHTKTKQRVVFIMDPNVESKAWGYREGFEDGENFEQGRWTVVNDQTDPGKEWKLSPLAVAYTGGHSIKMENFQNIRDNVSELISPAVNMDVIGGTGKVIRFKVAYALKTQTVTNNDRLIVSRTTNCGGTWTTVKSFNATELISGGLSPDAFTPNNRNLWKQVSVNLSGSAASGSNVRYRFQFVSGGPYNNNLYIDDIEIIATVGQNASIDEASAQTLNFNVYPNPVTDNSVVTFDLPESVNKASVSVYDITGRFVANIYAGQLSAGTQTFTINRERMNASGVYFVKVNLDGKELTEKIIAQ